VPKAEVSPFGSRGYSLLCHSHSLASGAFRRPGSIDSYAVPLLGANLLLFAGLNSAARRCDVESVDNEIHVDSDTIFDAAAGGTAVGYEIQQASTKRDFIAAVILGGGP
jgi:hypothetical protein